MLSLREIFDKVKTGLLAQGRKSLIASSDGVVRNICAYRGIGGSKCAAGMLILDEHYSPALEHQSVYAEPVHDALCKSGINMNDQQTNRLVSALQAIHDLNEFEAWPASFNRLAWPASFTIPDEEAK